MKEQMLSVEEKTMKTLLESDDNDLDMEDEEELRGNNDVPLQKDSENGWNTWVTRKFKEKGDKVYTCIQERDAISGTHTEEKTWRIWNSQETLKVR